MDSELSLISANQALIKPGFLMYDPFVGTGSFLVAAAYFGAFVLGSDIDGRKQPRYLYTCIIKFSFLIGSWRT